MRNKNSAFTMILLVIVACLGMLMWYASGQQDSEISQQTQSIETLREELTGLRAGAQTQAELILSTKYCKTDPSRDLCVGASKVIAQVNREVEALPSGSGIINVECSTAGEWIFTFADGTVQKPEGLCRVDPSIDPSNPPIREN